MTNEEAIQRIDDVLSSDYHYDETLGYQLTSDDFEWLETAKSALEKQIPKKPKILTWQPLIDAGWKHGCPNCGCAVGINKHLGFAYEEYLEPNESFCCSCGQALDWSDSE